MHQLQTEYFTADNADFTGPTGANIVSAGPQFASPYRLESVFYTRSSVIAIDLFLGILLNGVIYTVDTLAATTTKYYVFPNQRVPHPLALHPNARVVFWTNLCGAVGRHYVTINWAQFGYVC